MTIGPYSPQGGCTFPFKERVVVPRVGGRSRGELYLLHCGVGNREAREGRSSEGRSSEGRSQTKQESDLKSVRTALCDPIDLCDPIVE